MYKKIKNGSFMNLFWFIICMLPLIFLIFCTCQCKNKETKEIKNYFNSDTLTTSNNINYDYLTNTFYTSTNGTIALQFDINLNEINVNNLYLYFYNNASKNILWSYSLLKEDKTRINNTMVRNLDFNDNYLIIDLYNYIKENENNNPDFETPYYLQFGYGLRNSSEPYATNVRVGLFKENISNYDMLENSNFNYIIVNNNITIFLSNIYNSFASNGFINNTLIQVVNYFNVNNVYMQLAILYIEYFIIIQLLHLFVDFMLLIPNICHKFMEKVGGERD